MHENQTSYCSSEEILHVVNETHDDLIKSYERLVGKTVRDFTRNGKHVDKDDLTQEGFIALIEANKSFSVEMNTRFTTYAYHCINWKLHKYYRKPCNRKYGGFNEETGGRESQDNQFEIPCHEDEIQQKTNVQRESVESAINKLHDVERLIIRARFYEEKTLEEIGKCLGISKEGVRKKEKKAIEKLKFILRKD